MWSWRLGSVRGIDLNVHITFPLVLVWAAFQFGSGRADAIPYALFGAFLILVLFICVLLHELGHALVALRFGIPVDEIVLLPIGGLAKLRAMNDDPWEEFAIAIAGPLVNVLIAALLLPMILLFTNLLDPFVVGRLAGRFGGSEVQAALILMGRAMSTISLEGTLVYLFFANIMLTLFNLIPAFPMDGGRILRALLAFFVSYRWASILAVRTGQVLAILFVLWGFRSNPALILVAIFVLVSGSAELRRIELRETLTKGRISQFMIRGLHPLYPQWNLYSARLLAQQTGQNAFPVMLEGRLLGLLTVREMSDRSPRMTVGEAMLQDYSVVPPAGSLYDAQMKLHGADHFAAAVMEEGRLLGLLSLEEIERAYHALQQRPKVQVV